MGQGLHLPEGTAVMVTEDLATAEPPVVPGYTCSVLGDEQWPTYVVDGGPASTTPPTVTIKGNTKVRVTVTNGASCQSAPQEIRTTLQVTKTWVNGPNVPVDYPTLTSASAGTLTVTPTGQGWDVTASVEPSTQVTVTEAADAALPNYPGHTCTVIGQPSYTVNGGVPSESASFATTPGANTVVVTNTLDCVPVVTPPTQPPVAPETPVTPEAPETPVAPEAPETPVIEGIEDSASDSEQEAVVAGTEDELADTGADPGIAPLGLLLIGMGAAFLAMRRLSIR